MTALEVLKGARKLLERPGAWQQGFSATGANGMCTDPAGEAACKWCLAGAVLRIACGDEAQWSAREAMGFFGSGSVAGWNDEPGRTQQDVLDRLDQAIAKLEQENDL